MAPAEDFLYQGKGDEPSLLARTAPDMGKPAHWIASVEISLHNLSTDVHKKVRNLLR